MAHNRKLYTAYALKEDLCSVLPSWMYRQVAMIRLLRIDIALKISRV